MLLTAYIAGFSFVLESGSEQVSIQTFEDLVKQGHLEFGTMESSSTLQYFKVGLAMFGCQGFQPWGMTAKTSCMETLADSIPNVVGTEQA